MPRLSIVLPAAGVLSAFAFASPAGAEVFACSYIKVCTPNALCADHATDLSLVAPVMTVENETASSDGANQTPGTVEASGPGVGDGERSYSAPERGTVTWGTKTVEVIEPAQDRAHSTRAFMSLGVEDYVLTVTPDNGSQLAFFVDSELVSTLEGSCTRLDDEDDEEGA